MAQMPGDETVVDRAIAEALIEGLVDIPSLSMQEANASRWLVDRMATLGFTRAYVDDAGNAVGEMGSEDASRVVMLLGHIDTVPGAIPVRVEATAAGRTLFGRGSVDAKGPLATFVAAVARVGARAAIANDVRFVVVGAVEEEAATSAGARYIRDRFDGVAEPVPVACIIGEPSSWRRVTLGYKGRLLVDFSASQPMAHTAGPDAGVATVAVDLWNQVSAFAADFNRDRPRAFDQILPSLRNLNTRTNAQMWDEVEARVGMRLPTGFDVHELLASLVAWAAESAGVDGGDLLARIPADSQAFDIVAEGAGRIVSLHFHAYEAAWRADRNNFLVRSFLAAIRQVQLKARPGFVVKTGTSDMNVVAPAWRCPILAYGPGDSSLDHTPDEHLLLDEYWQAILVLEQALLRTAESVRAG